MKNLAGFIKPVEPLGEGAELNAVRITLLLVPPGPDTKLETPVTNDVDAGNHVRQ